MKINAMKFGFASAIVFAVVWIVCSLLVYSMPIGMMQMSGQMVHSNLEQMPWVLTFGGFVYGLLAWSGLAGLITWAIAAVYNRLQS